MHAAAREVGLAEAAVAKLREEFFGSLKEPAEIQQWRDKIAALEARANKMENEAGDACAAILKELRQLSSKIDSAVERNGW